MGNADRGDDDCEIFHRLHHQGKTFTLQKLSGAGVDVSGISAAEVLATMEAEDDSKAESGRLVDLLIPALQEHGLLWFHGSSSSDGSHSLTPLQIRGLYSRFHRARFPALDFVIPKQTTKNANQKATSESENIRHNLFPGFPESALLGHVPEGIKDYHGLTGKLVAGAAWWTKQSCQFHHDGAFMANSSKIPALVAMYCEEAPTDDSGIEGFTMKWQTGESMYCAPGATLFYQTGRALTLASPEVASRARRMRCVYTGGFGRIQVDKYPRMSDTFLTALEAPKGPKGNYKSVTEFEIDSASVVNDGKLCNDCFQHDLVQRDVEGREYVVVHAVCLEELQEYDTTSCSWKSLTFDESREFIETLLGPAAKAPFIQAVNWKPGDFVIFDNVQLQHSVTPSDVYANGDHPSQHRLMIRTAMQPTRNILGDMEATAI